jgi:hypothetical protein
MRQLFKFGLSFSLDPLLDYIPQNLMIDDILPFWDSLIQCLEKIVDANKSENSPQTQFPNLFNGRSLDLGTCNNCGVSITERRDWKSITFNNEHKNFTDSMNNPELKPNRDFKCPKCNNVSIFKITQTFIERLPEYLVIRESYRIKKNNFEQDLRIVDYYNHSRNYKLFAIIALLPPVVDPPTGRRYISYINWNTWWRFDRNTVTEANINQIIQDDRDTPYVFIYASQDVFPTFPAYPFLEKYQYHRTTELLLFFQKYPPSSPPDWFWTFQPNLYTREINQESAYSSNYIRTLSVRQSFVGRTNNVWPTCTFCNQNNVSNKDLFSRLCTYCYKAN